MTCPSCGKSDIHTCSPQVLIVHPEPDTYEQLVKPVPIDRNIKLIPGELGTIDGRIRIVESQP